MYKRLKRIITAGPSHRCEALQTAVKRGWITEDEKEEIIASKPKDE